MADRYEMVVEQDIGIPMRDGAVLRANFYHPKAEGKFPVLMSFGPYGKDVPLKEFMAEAWDTLEKFYPGDPASLVAASILSSRPPIRNASCPTAISSSRSIVAARQVARPLGAELARRIPRLL